MRPSAIIAIVASAQILCGGCRHAEVAKPEYRPPVILGDRVRIVRPGDIVPGYPEGSHVWILGDGIGLSQWLGIPMDAIMSDGDAYDSAMDGIDEAERIMMELERRFGTWQKQCPD